MALEMSKWLGRAIFDFSPPAKFSEHEHRALFITAFGQVNEIVSIIFGPFERISILADDPVSLPGFEAQSVRRKFTYVMDFSELVRRSSEISESIYRSDNMQLILNLSDDCSLMVSMDPIYFKLERMDQR